MTLNNARISSVKRKKMDSTQQSEITIIKTITKCSGYEWNKLIYTNFPFQMFELYDLPFVVENGKLHGLNCSRNNYTYVENKESNSINMECFNLKYNSALSKITDRAVNISKYANHDYMNFNQFVHKIELYKTRINDYHLKCLHQDFIIIAYRNKMSLYKRFISLLATKDVNRVRDLIKVCLNNGSGIQGMIRKFNEAANDLYKPKAFTENETDLALLVLRLGGPSLLHVFSKQNKLPTASYIYKVSN